MSRPLRIEYNGAWYHVMNRGQCKRDIFYSRLDYEIFLELLGEISELSSIQIHAFSLMPNHYHLLVHTPKKGLSKPMQHLNGCYTQKFNKLHDRDGPLFKGRFKAILADSKEYLTKLLSYIHMNPVEAYITKRPEDHEWTSHKDYKNKELRLSWLKTDILFRCFGGENKEGLAKLDSFVKEGLTEEAIKEINNARVILGKEAFQKWVCEEFVDEKKMKDVEIPMIEKQPNQEVISADDIFRAVADIYNINSEQLLYPCIGVNNEARKIAVYLLRYCGQYSHKQIADILQANIFTISSIIQRFKEEIKTNKRLKQQIEEVKTGVKPVHHAFLHDAQV